MSHLASEDQMTTPTPEKKVRDHRGQKNPHFGHAMSPKSKQAISTQQSLRYSAIRQLMDGMQNQITEDRVREIITETINDYFARNTTEVKNNKPNNIPL